jgi:cell division protein FtsI/penicillin-binding protein 2
VELKQAIGSDIAEKIEKLALKGVFLTETTKRTYPNDELAAHVLGFMTMDAKAVSGLELQYDDILRGKDGIKKYRTDRWGNPLPYEREQLKAAVDGQDIWLTLDETIQHYAEDALDNVVKEYKPKNASIVVMDPNSGEILAMANRPTYNPNKFWESNNETLSNNWAMNKSFEPGSTFKIVTMTAALNEQKVSLDSAFNSGRIQVGKTTIGDWNNGQGWGAIPFREGFYRSSNVAMIELAKRLGWDKLYDYIGKFGFNQKTGVDLPGEGSSQLFTEKSDLNLAVTSFGQGNAVTPMQQVAAVSAVANGGSVMRPFLMKEVRDPKTAATVQEQKSHVISQVANPEVMKTVRDLMEGVVTFDESKKAYLEGYKIAGKTGTAQIAKTDGPGYDDNNFITSFIGFAPSDKPKLLVYVTVDSPKTDLQFGNVVASPAAKEVFGNVLPMMGYRVENGKPVDTNKDQNQIKFATTPTWNGMNRQQAQDAAKNNQLQVQILGAADKITAQWPQAGMKVPTGSVVYLFAGNAKDAQGNVQVPNLTGKTFGEAVEILSMVELGVDPSGAGIVVGQEQKAGSVVPAGTKIKLQLGPN